MEKLGQLHADAQATGRWDLIVVDTPRPGRRWTSSTPPSGCRASSTAGSSGCCWPRPAARPG